MQFHENMLEARVGIEPTHKGFADLSLTAWVPRPKSHSIQKLLAVAATAPGFDNALALSWFLRG